MKLYRITLNHACFGVDVDDNNIIKEVPRPSSVDFWKNKDFDMFKKWLNNKYNNTKIERIQ